MADADVPPFISADDEAFYDELRVADPAAAALIGADLAFRRSWWRQVGEYCGTRTPIDTVEVRPS